MKSTSEAPRPGELQRLGRYRIVRPLSKGGMALVYEARRESLAGVSPRVAIKLILPEHENSETFRELFVNEARLGASMQHQNLVQIQDFDCEGDRWFLVMEYVEGLTLRRIISLCQKHGIQIPLSVVAELGRQACDGLHYAHGARDEEGRPLHLVHRDVKPSNLILNPHGVLKVLDFGISKGALRSERRGSVKGTWGYMAPEQASGSDVDATADVFGLATVLYELAALRPIFKDKKRDEIRRLLLDDHPARMVATLDSAYAPLVQPLVCALQRDPKARYQSAGELGRALASQLSDPITARDDLIRFYEQLAELDARPPTPAPAPVASPPPVPKPMPPPPRRPQKVGGMWLPGLAVALAVLVILGVSQLPERVTSVDSDDVEPAPEPVRPALVVDEPAGPAGVGAPGELRDRRPPRAAASIAAVPVSPAPESARLAVVPQAPATSGSEAHATSGADSASEADSAPDAEVGVLVVGARQEAEVYIGGQFVDRAPVRRELPAGRYAVSLVARDGRRRSFEVEIQPGKRIQRTWDFDRMEWR